MRSYNFLFNYFSLCARNVLWAELCPNPIRSDYSLYTSSLVGFPLSFLCPFFPFHPGVATVQRESRQGWWNKDGRLFYMYRWRWSWCSCEKSVFSVCILVQGLLLRWLSRQVGNQCSDGADVRYDPKHNGEHWKPQCLARCCVGPLKVSLSRCLVGLRSEGERERRVR